MPIDNENCAIYLFILCMTYVLSVKWYIDSFTVCVTSTDTRITISSMFC